MLCIAAIVTTYLLECIFILFVWYYRLGFKSIVEAWSASTDLDGIIGAACSTVCQPVGLLAAVWNLPMVSFTCTSDYLSDKEVYPTFTRSTGPYGLISFTIDAILDVFGYVHSFAIHVYESEDCGS